MIDLEAIIQDIEEIAADIGGDDDVADALLQHAQTLVNEVVRLQAEIDRLNKLLWAG